MLCKQHASDEEFLVLWENYESKNPDFPRDSYDPFTLKNMQDAAECKAEFRVKKNCKYSVWGVTSYSELLRVLTSIPLPNFVLLTLI